MTPDRIVLAGVRARGHHGVLDHEKRDGQEFVVDVVMTVDLTRAGDTDDLEHTVNYAEVAADVVRRIEGPSLDLIEALADQIAGDVLARPLVEAVEVVVHKPSAPVGVPFGDVQVRISRVARRPVVVALGANLGQAPETLRSALLDLGAGPMRVDAVAPFVATDPVGGPEQPDYTNTVAVGTTSLSPWHLLEELHGIEARHGRTREVRWGARTLDLDLIQYGDPRTGDDVVSADPALTLPHPRAHERAFVLQPWTAADPDAELRTEWGVVPVSDLLRSVGTDGVREMPEEPTW
ncbi:2-amino-4-hydroxy-6-hydroxymethyldihydropteridine diphosphokinase [Janibacter sp. G1551]|uniref:2-amino-4-hydroxy-6- hydroxymethyldihydropteridine diphosphokinase n=1 Tax=Janibacter sp. G1551 TaxID=3420440 RepID=UPI003D025308